MTRAAATTTATKQKQATATMLPAQPLSPRAPADDVDEPLVVAKPPPGRSGDLKVKKALLDALERDPQAVDPRLHRLKAAFVQGVDGARAVTLRLDIAVDGDFPTVAGGADEDVMVRELDRLQQAGVARCAAVLGADFSVLSVFFGGKKLR